MQSKIQSNFLEGVYGPQMRILKACIAEGAELSFRSHITGSKANVTNSIHVNKIVDDILMQPVCP